MLYDLIIIGGGPAGTSAAISAAARRRSRPAAGAWTISPPQSVRRICLRRISRPAQRASCIDDHAPLLHDAVRIPQARVFLDGRTLQTAVDPPAASIARLDLDAALWHSAESAGVDARQQITVQSIAGDRSVPRGDHRRRI